MRINPSDFFRFCSQHTALLRELVDSSDAELSDSQLFGIIRRCADESEEQAETVLKRLKALRIVEPTEQQQGFYVVAGPLVQLLRFLLYEAKPATPQTVRGYVNSLDELCKLLARALEAENVTHVELAIGDINQTLRRIFDDVAATHGSILGAVAEFKTTRRGVSVRERFQRIVYWMEMYVVPMIEIIRVDGVMEATLAETARLLRLATDQTLFSDLGAIERNLHFIRLVRRHALRVFEECRKEIQPLYQALARSNDIAAGAVTALERLRCDGVQKWGSEPLTYIFSFRQQYAVSDSALNAVLARVILQPPEAAPIINFDDTAQEPDAMRQRRWLDSLPERLASAVPMEDLMRWIVTNSDDGNTSKILAAFSLLLFHDGFQARFVPGETYTYETNDHVVRGKRVEIERMQT